MHKITWRAQAESDLMEIVERIWQDSPQRAVTFGEEIRAKTETLRKHSKLYRIGRKRGTHELVAHPNYLVIYRIQGKTVEILRVKHTAQRWP